MAAQPTLKTLAQKRVNPGTRSKLKDSQLTASQLHERKRLAAVKADPIGYQVNKDAGAIFAPQTQSINQGIQDTRTQSAKLASNAKDYSSQIATHDVAAQAKQAAFGAALTKTQGDIAAASAADIANLSKPDPTSAQADAQRGGGLSTVAPSGETAALGARASTQGAAQQTAGEQQSVNYASLLNVMSQARQQHGGEVQDQIGIQRGNDILKGQSDLKDLAGAKAKYIADTTYSRGQDSVTNQLAANALHVKLAGITSTAKTAANALTGREKIAAAAVTSRERIAGAAQDRQDARQAASTDAGFLKTTGLTEAGFLKLSPAQRDARIKAYKATGKSIKPTSGPGSITPQQSNQIISNVKGAKNAATRALGVKNATPAEVRAALAQGAVDGHRYTPDEINAAFDLLPTNLGGKGGLSKANIAALHAAGVKISGRLPLAGLNLFG